MKTWLLASVAIFTLPAAVSAQNAAPAKVAAADAANAGEIVITATQRSQVLSEVPIAVSAVSAEQLKYSGGSDIRQLNQLAPSLLVSEATNDSNAAARIRGIGTVGENPGLESSVAVFIDGVYRARTGVGLQELGAIDRVEVLRGPQGTLFGRNASAGLINIITARPSFDTAGTAEFSYGNFNAYRGQASITGPIAGDKLAARLDGVYFKRDGFLTDVISGRKTANRDRYLIRGQLLFQPSPDWSVRVIGDYSHKNEECCAAAYLEPLRNLSRDASGNVIQSPNSIAGIIRGLGGTIVEPLDGSKFSRQTAISAGRSFQQKTRDYGASAEIKGNLGPVNLTSISAYRVYKNDGAQDGDFSSLDLLYRSDLKRKFETYSQELRLQGKAFNDRLDFLVGGYYAHEQLTYQDDLKYGNDWERYENAQIAPFGITLNTLAAAAGYTPPAGQSLLNNTGIVNDSYKQVDRNYALFTHNVLQIVPDKLQFTVGLRYTNDQKTLDTTFVQNNNFCSALRAGPFTGPFAPLNAFRPTGIAIACAVNSTTGPGFGPSSPGATKNEERLTGTAVISFKPVDHLLTYASFSRGYKAGGFNLDTAALNAATPSANDLRFDPEIVNAYEIGAKIDLHEFKLNAAIFYESFKNFQLNLFNGLNFQVTNVESCKDDLGGRDTNAISTDSACDPTHLKDGVTAKGIELEAYMYPARDIAVSAGMTYAQTKYATNLTGTAGSSLGAALFQLPGSQISNAPEYVVTGSFAWTPQINERFSALVYADFRYQSATNTGSDLDIEKVQQGFAVVNARLGLYGQDKKWGIEFWSQNLLNEKYQQVAADAPAQGSGTFRGVATGIQATANQLYITFPAEPRTFGVTVRTRF